MSKVRILGIEEFGENGRRLKDFYCSDLKKHLQVHSKRITAPHKHDFFLVVLFTNGSGMHEVDFEKHEVTPGSIFMLSPGQAHYWELSADVEGVILFHTQEFFEVSFQKQAIYEFPFFQSVQNSSAIFLKPEDQTKASYTFNSILKEFTNQDPLSGLKIASLLNVLYIDLSRVYSQTADETLGNVESNMRYVAQLQQLIEVNFKEERSPSWYADQLSITIRHLNRQVNLALGKSTSQLIAERVILEAKRLIVYDPSSLAKISYELGYEDYAYFSRLFKKWTGQTPMAFSKEYSKAN